MSSPAAFERLAGTSGLETARLIKTTLPEVPIVMMSAIDSPSFPAGVEWEAMDWVDKLRIATDLVPVIRKYCSET